MRPRQVGKAGAGGEVGERHAAVDASGPVALVLLGLVALELVLRVGARRSAAAA
jgi:hypothetical protein